MSVYEVMDLIYRTYVGLLTLVCVAVLFQKRSDVLALWKLILSIPPMRRTAAALFANWAVNTAFVVATGIHDPWFWFIATDALSAAIVMRQPAGRQQSVIGALYMTQILMHGLYAASNHRVAEYNYWQVLMLLACIQLLLLGTWYAGRLWRRVFSSQRARVALAEGG